jgi:hypothetical protein
VTCSSRHTYCPLTHRLRDRSAIGRTPSGLQRPPTKVQPGDKAQVEAFTRILDGFIQRVAESTALDILASGPRAYLPSPRVCPGRAAPTWHDSLVGAIGSLAMRPGHRPDRGCLEALAIERIGEYVVSQGFLRDRLSGPEEFGCAWSELFGEPVGEPAGVGVRDRAAWA